MSTFYTLLTTAENFMRPNELTIAFSDIIMYRHYSTYFLFRHMRKFKYSEYAYDTLYIPTIPSIILNYPTFLALFKNLSDFPTP